MAEDTSPNSLSGAPNATDELLEMVKPQATPQPSLMPAPQDGSVTGAAPGFGPIAGLPPEPAKGGISEDIGTQFARQLAKNTDTLTQSNPAAVAKPGGWARAILGGAMTTLAGGGFSLGQPQPEGSVGINGVQSAVNAYKDRLRDSQNRAAAQKQQSFENDLKLRKEKREEEAQNASIALNKIAIEKAQSGMSQEAQERINKFYQQWAKDEKENKGAILIQEGMTHDELGDLAKRHATPDDPNGSHWLAAQDVRQDGFRVDTDVNGDPIQEIGPDGKPTGRQERTKTWAAYTYGDPMPMSAQIAAQAKKYGLGNFAEGDTLKPQDAALLRVQIGKAITDESASEALALAAGKDKEALAELQQKAGYRDAGEALAPFLADSKGNVGEALQNMASHAMEKGPDGKQTPEAQEALKRYNNVIKFYGNDIVKHLLDQNEKETIENIKAAATKAKGAPQELEGDPTLSGVAYINSLPPGRQDLVRQVVSGQINGISPRLLAGKDGQLLMAEAAKADPDLDTGKIATYPALLKSFTVGKEAQQIKAINTVVPHLDDLYKAIENGTGTTIPGLSWVERKFGNQAAIDVKTLREIATQEEAKAYATGAVTDQEHRAFGDQIQGFKTPTELKGTIYSLVTALDRQINSLENQWQEGLPSPHWRPNRAIVDGDAKKAMDDVTSRHAGTGPLNQTPAAPKAVSIGGKQVPLNADGTVTVGGHPYTISPDGKSLTLVNPAGTK